jgi:hypothetical protein
MTQYTTNDSPKLCECGCGALLPIPKYPSRQARYVHGHNGRQNKGRVIKPAEDRFWQYANTGPFTDCWEWTGTITYKGYGSIGIAGRDVPAHRFSFELHNGPIPEGMLVCHHCDNRCCVNPYHLFLGTHQDNSRDMHAKGRQPYHTGKGERNASAKLTAADVRQIRELYTQGMKQAELARQFRVSCGCIFGIVHHRIWSHI